MPGARRQDGDIAGRNLKRLAKVAAEANAGVAARVFMVSTLASKPTA